MNRICLALLLAALAACSTAPSTPPLDWPHFLAKFQDDYFAADPPFAVHQGRHEYDGKLPDWSQAAIDKRIDELKASRKVAERYDDAALTPQQRFEKQYLLSRIDTDLFWMDEAGQPFNNPSWYLDDELDPSVYVARPYAPAAKRLKAYIAYLQAVPAAAAQIRANLRMPQPHTFIDLAEKSAGGYASFYRHDAQKAFKSVHDKPLLAQLAAATEPAAQAMDDLVTWLKAQEPKGTDDFALGASKFRDMLWMTERVDTPLDQLEAIGRADLERNLASLRDACAHFLPKDNVEHCVAKMASHKPTGGPVSGARAQLADIRKFILDRKLVTIPSQERALVAEAPEYRRWNFAYIDIPGPYDKGLPSTYYIAPPDPIWSKADRAAYLPGKADLLFTSVHEVWPGHFLQFLHSNRSSFTFGQVFVGYAFSEGWAHYGEEMMWEAGLGNGSPETHIGQLSNALLRNVRFLCAIGLHTQGMSVQTCDTMFREQAFQDPGNARQQAARGTYDPAYLNYTMGKLMIRKLRADWTATRGGRKAWREFHDGLLSYGGPPLPLVRTLMLGAGDKGALFEAPAK